jgi:hypothetical protein
MQFPSGLGRNQSRMTVQRVPSGRRPGPGGEVSGGCPLCNLAPADLKKDANGFDLSIALGLLLASGQVAFDRPGNFAIVGELALTGETRPISLGSDRVRSFPAQAEGEFQRQQISPRGSSVGSDRYNV